MKKKNNDKTYILQEGESTEKFPQLGDGIGKAKVSENERLRSDVDFLLMMADEEVAT